MEKKTHWIHVYSSGDVTLKCLHRKRGKEAMEAINIIPRYGGVIVHDCWASYLSYLQCHHGLCGSHILRELTFIVQSNGYRWAKNIKRLLKTACKMVSQSQEKCLPIQQYKKLHQYFVGHLKGAETELPPIPKKAKGQRGKIAQSDAHNLFDRLTKHQDAVLLFASNPHVAFTNNRAERDLRMAKVKQKVSGCFRSEQYAHAYCRISSYLQTKANQGVNPLIAIQSAFQNDFST